MCSGRGYHVLGYFILKQYVKNLYPILCTFLSTLLLTVTSLYGAPARARIVFLVRVSAVAGVSRCTSATRLRSNELNIASHMVPILSLQTMAQATPLSSCGTTWKRLGSFNPVP